jgi:uncharacterized membrane protein YczE
VRTVLEAVVMAVGFALGGDVGIGTLAFVVGIGPLVHILIPKLEMAKGGGRESIAVSEMGV